MVLVLAKCGKISNVQVARSAVTVVLKKDILAVRKSCDSYHEIVVTAVIRQLFLWVEADEVS